MQAHGLEPEMEEFLLKLVPGLAREWLGASPGEIAQIEGLAGRPLPSFYRWFLSRMGRSMGPMAYPRLDFSAQRVIESYAEELVAPDSRFLLIGHESDEMMPLHVFYDLDLPVRGDARVTKRHALGGDLHDQFETFREMLAWRAFLEWRVQSMPQRCSVALMGQVPNILLELDPLLSQMGFTRPGIPTGPSCGLYERPDVALLGTNTPRNTPESFMFFYLGGKDSGSLRRVLGEISIGSALKVLEPKWDPRLP